MAQAPPSDRAQVQSGERPFASSCHNPVFTLNTVCFSSSSSSSLSPPLTSYTASARFPGSSATTPPHPPTSSTSISLRMRGRTIQLLLKNEMEIMISSF